MKWRRLKIRADTKSIAFSHITDQESGDEIAGVMNITWTYESNGDPAVVILTLDASMVDFEVIPPSPPHKE
jgi:hypothetical protein